MLNNCCKNAEECNYQHITGKQLAKRMRIPYFRGIFIVLSYQGGMYRNESSIVWIMLMDQILYLLILYLLAYAKQRDHAVYFDSFGNLRPPMELVRNIWT